MRPHISVVIACRNERATLAACLDALDSQDYGASRFETIVVDGGSTDGSRELAARRRVRVLSDGANGPAGARNVGIGAARAPIVAFTDADCVPEQDWLARIAEVFEEDAALGGVGGGLRMKRATRLGELEDMEARAWYRGFITSNVAYRRGVLLSVGGFDETLKCAEDYDLAWRVIDAGHRVVHDPRPVVMHAPPELEGGIRRYLLKQFWYARCDVPAHARALARAYRLPTSTPGSALAATGAASALGSSGWTLAAALGMAAAQPWLAGGALVGAAGSAARHVSRTMRYCGERPSRIGAAVGVVMARQLVRGAGTLAGLADLARPSAREQLKAPGPIALAREAPALVPGSPS